MIMQTSLNGFITTRGIENPFAGASSVNEVFALLVKMLSTRFKGAIVTTMVYNETAQNLATGPGFEVLSLEIQSAMQSIPLGVGACGTAVCEKQIVIIQDIQTIEPPLPFLNSCQKAGLRSLWSVPVLFDDYIYGTIAIFHRHPYIPSQTEIQTASSLANSAASALIVSKLRQQKNELEKNRASFLEAQKIARLGTWEWDPQEAKSIWSPEAFLLFGLEPRTDGIIYHSEVFSIVHPDDAEILKLAVRRAKQGLPYDIELRVILPNGEERFLRSRKNPNIYGNIVMGTVQDITDRKKTEQQLLESREQYRSLIDYNSDGICSFDLNGHFTGANPAFRDLTGYSIFELSQMSYADITFEVDINKTRPYSEQILQGNNQKNMECTLKHKDGSPIYVRYTNIPMMINRKLVGMYTLIKDVSLEKRAEEMLRQSEKLSVVGQLAAGFAHEIRNPLTSLKGFLQLLEKTHKMDRHAKHVEIMLDEIKHIENITSQLLILAKPQADKVTTCDLAPIIQAVTSFLEPQALLKGTEIVCNLCNEAIMIQCVPNQMKQVFINLIKNALESMQSGGTVTVQANRSSDKVSVSVQDEGVGIPEQSLTQIFEPFFTTKDNGTGLGLMVTHNIIERHHGKLNITSQPGIGTKVTVTLPIHLHE